MKQLIGYCRVSTEDQGSRRNGLEAQREEIERFAQQEGYNLVCIVEEVASGKLGFDKRPVLLAALKKAKALRGAIVVSKLDRLSRHSYFVHKLIEEKVDFIVSELGADTEPFLLQMFGVLAEKERTMISQRTKAALKQVKARGVLLGNRTNLPSAQALGRATVQTRAKEFANSVIPIMQPLRSKGQSYKAMAESLNSMKVPSFKGGLWSDVTVRDTYLRGICNEL